jgi:hypothetical protein
LPFFGLVVVVFGLLLAVLRFRAAARAALPFDGFSWVPRNPTDDPSSLISVASIVSDSPDPHAKPLLRVCAKCNSPRAFVFCSECGAQQPLMAIRSRAMTDRLWQHDFATK